MRLFSTQASLIILSRLVSWLFNYRQNCLLGHRGVRIGIGSLAPCISICQAAAIQ